MKWVGIKLKEALKPQQWQALVKQLQSNMCTEPYNRRTHTSIHSSPDTQNTHLTLKRRRLTATTCCPDRSNLIYNACVCACLCVCVECVKEKEIVCVRESSCEMEISRVRGQNCKFDCHISCQSLCPLYSLSVPHTHTNMHTHTITDFHTRCTTNPCSYSFQSPR